MGCALICIAILIALFIPAFVTKRRFGLLGLALAAGSLINGIWGYDFGLIAGIFSIPSNIYTSNIVSIIIILTPALLFLLRGSSYKTFIGRFIGASAFALLAFAFLIEPLSRMQILQGFGGNIYGLLINNKDIIIGVGMIASIADIFITRSPNLSNRRRKH